MNDTTRESAERWEVTHNTNGLGFSDGIRQSPHGNFVALADYTALLTRAEAAEAERDALQSKLDAQGRELNRVKYGEPDFSWAIHKAAMADLRAKLAVAAEALSSAADDLDDYSPLTGNSIALIKKETGQ